MAGLLVWACEFIVEALSLKLDSVIAKSNED